jgi:hypothetical protein
MYCIAQEYRLLVVESAKKATAAGIAACTTVSPDSLPSQTYQLELISNPHKRCLDDSDKPSNRKKRRGALVELPSPSQLATLQQSALQQPKMDTLPESSVCALDTYPILTAVDRLSEQKMNSGLNAIKKTLGILKFIANRQRMVQNASVCAMDGFRERSQMLLRTVDVKLTGARISEVPEVEGLSDIYTISKPDLDKRMLTWQLLGWKALKRIVELLSKKKHRREYLDMCATTCPEGTIDKFRDAALEVLSNVEEFCPSDIPRRQIR